MNSISLTALVLLERGLFAEFDSDVESFRVDCGNAGHLMFERVEGSDKAEGTATFQVARFGTAADTEDLAIPCATGVLYSRRAAIEAQRVFDQMAREVV